MMTALIPRLKAMGIPAASRKKDIANIDDIDFFAFLKDAIWTENERQQNWEKTMKDLKSEISDDDLVTIIDCHF